MRTRVAGERRAIMPDNHLLYKWLQGRHDFELASPRCYQELVPSILNKWEWFQKHAERNGTMLTMNGRLLGLAHAEFGSAFFYQQDIWKVLYRSDSTSFGVPSVENEFLAHCEQLHRICFNRMSGICKNVALGHAPLERWRLVFCPAPDQLHVIFSEVDATLPVHFDDNANNGIAFCRVVESQ